MSGLDKRKISNKALRLDSRMAKDIEILSGCTGRSQNDIIVLAVKKYLFENRKYFTEALIDDVFLEKLRHQVMVMHQEVHIEFGHICLDVTKTDNPDDYFIRLTKKNMYGELISNDESEINIVTDDWADCNRYLCEKIKEYIEFDESETRNYFGDKFSYE